MSIRQILITVCFLIPCVGCGTPTAVRNLSAVQSRTMESYQQSLKTYFNVVMKFADGQVAAANAIINSNVREMTDLQKEDALDNLGKAKTPEDRSAALNNYTKAILQFRSTAEGQLQSISENVNKLRAKQEEMISAYGELVRAQKALDEYIQMKKADEVILDDLAQLVGINQEKLTQSVTDIAQISQTIQTDIKSLQNQK